MRVLVTGSTGFIGSHLVPRLTARGHSVTGLDCVVPKTMPSGMAFHEVDLMDRPRLHRALAEIRPDALVHLAARTDVEETRNLDAYAANMEGVSHLLEGVRAIGCLRRAIYASTQLVCKLGYRPAHDEDYCADTLYGRSKVETERRVRAADGGAVDSWVLVRPTTIWGPGMNPRYLPFFRMIARGRFVHVTRRPLLKSYGFVGNTVHQIAQLLEAPADRVHRRTLYLADYEPLSLRAWAEAFRARLGAGRIPTIPTWMAWSAATAGSVLWTAGLKGIPFTRYRLQNMLNEYVYDLSETQAICGPLPHSFEQSLDETWRWLQQMGIGATGPETPGQSVHIATKHDEPTAI